MPSTFKKLLIFVFSEKGCIWQLLIRTYSIKLAFCDELHLSEFVISIYFLNLLLVNVNVTSTLVSSKSAAQKMKFAIKEFFSKCDQICNFLWIWTHLLKKSLMENFIFCAAVLKCMLKQLLQMCVL